LPAAFCLQVKQRWLQITWGRLVLHQGARPKKKLRRPPVEADIFMPEKVSCVYLYECKGFYN
jgi:hypothetical protein